MGNALRAGLLGTLSNKHNQLLETVGASPNLKIRARDGCSSHLDMVEALQASDS